MAGKGGTIPKPAAQRARRNVDHVQGAVIRFVPGTQPALPDGVEWPEPTKTWWAMWGRTQQATMFTDSDWSALLDTALVHRRHWNGDPTAAAELRLREAKFGATPEDRARLRITFVNADVAEAKVQPASPAKQAYRGLGTVAADAVEAA